MVLISYLYVDGFLSFLHIYLYWWVFPFIIFLFCLCLVTSLCLTLCNPMDCSVLGSSSHGILQARILERVAIPFSRGSPHPRDHPQASRIAGRFSVVWAMKEDFSFENSYNIDVGSLDVFPEVSETVLISFFSFFSMLLCFSYFQLFYLPAHLSNLLPQLCTY